MRERRYRVVKVHEGYSLQYRRWWGGWTTICGFDRGAPGYYNYQRDRSGNPFILVKDTLVEVEYEREHPTLSALSVRAARFRGRCLNPKSPKVERVFSVDAIRAALDRWSAEGKMAVLTPYPPMSYIGEQGT